MTVAELRTILAALPDDYLVVLAVDGEGNEFIPIDRVESGEYTAVSWTGDFESDIPITQHNAICLWPVH